MRSIHGSLLVTVKSPLLIAGRGSPGSVVDAATELTSSGEPFIPSSTLKGAIREACARLARGRGDSTCSLAAPCAPAKLCVLCQLFGTPGPDRPGLIRPEDVRLQSDIGSEGGLHFGDATGAGKADLSVRPSVAIGRQAGAAAEGLLAMVEVADAPAAPLRASLHGHVPEKAWELFHDALDLVDGVGHGRTRGLGHVSIAWAPAPAPAPPAVAVERAGDRQALLRVRPKQPLVLGSFGAGNITESLDHVQGSTLRGALAKAVLRGGVPPQDPRFQRLFVDPKTCLRFSDAWPTNDKNTLPLPRPQTTLVCKRHPHEPKEKPRYHDVLLQHALAGRVVAGGGTPTLPRCTVKDCGEDMKSGIGVYPEMKLKRRIVTRLGRDVATGSGMPALLFSVEQILPEDGLTFVGTVDGLDDDARALLAQAGPVYLGRGRSLSQGLAEVEIAALPASASRAGLKRRWETFATAATDLLKIARAHAPKPAELPADPRRLIAVLARTDVSLRTAAVQQALFGDRGADVLWCQLRHRQRGGWDQGFTPGKTEPRPRPRDLLTVIAAGSVWLFACEGEPPTPEHLLALEREGLPSPTDEDEQRHLGLNQVSFFPEPLLQGWPS